MAKVNFRTNVLLKSIIGKDLITDDNLAILELVKNSFDAGSNRVDILFENIVKNDDKSPKAPSTNSSKIIISDVGKGMSETDLIDKWLNIAYSEKKEKREEYGRVLAGNKGVGRFSCDRLGKFLTIYTRRECESIVKLFIDWKSFEIDNKIDLNIQDIELETELIPTKDFTRITGYPLFAKGTILEISALRSIWNHKKILSLKRQLERLINPNQTFRSTKFDIFISAAELKKYEESLEDYEKVNGLVKNKIFEKLSFKATSIQSKITKDGNHIITILNDRGRNIFTLIEKNKFDQLKDIRLHIYYLNPYSKAYFTKQTGIRSVEFGSIFLFINGFKVPPYGDIGDDWLGMENRKGQGRARYLGTREVIGRVEIKDQENVFQIISNRSGVVNDEAFLQLTKNSTPYGYYYKIFRRLERFVVEGIHWDSIFEKDYNKIEKDILENPEWDESKENYLEDSLARNTRILKTIKNIIDLKKDDVIKLEINEFFVNDIIKEQSDKIKTELDSIAEQINSKNISTEDLTSFLKKISDSRDSIKNLSRIIMPYSNSDILGIIDSDLEFKYEELKSEKEKLEERLKKAEEARKRAENDLELEKLKTEFYKKQSSPDTDALIHHVKNNNLQIRDTITNLITELHGYNDDRTLNLILEPLYRILHYTDKSLKATDLILQSDLELADAQTINLSSFVDGYFKSNSFGIKVNVLKLPPLFEIIASKLDLALILDNLLDNSKKWAANNIWIHAEVKNDIFLMNFYDDGQGLDDQFKDDPDAIFNFKRSGKKGGTGFGLYLVKEALVKMNADIYIDEKIDNKGMNFKLIFR